MTNIIIYTPPPYKESGGLSNFKLVLEILINLKYVVYFCPLLKDVPSLNFISPFNDTLINNITHQQFIDYYINPDCESHTVPIQNIVSPEILLKKNNIVIYAEDVIGNPAQQKYVVRWLHFFPIPGAVKKYDFENDFICFYSDYIYNFYKYICKSCNCPDYLTEKIKTPNICRVFKFEPNIYSKINKYKKTPILDMKINKKCFTFRKLFPPYSFKKYTDNVNRQYAKEIIYNHNVKLQYKINRLNLIQTRSFMLNFIQMNEKKNLVNEICLLKQNTPNNFSDDNIRKYLQHKYSSLGFEEIGAKKDSQEFIKYFCKKDYFLSFDPFTFMSIIASLSGCISVVQKIESINHDTWINGDPFIKYGIAYGNEGIAHAIETQHLLLPHIIEMYNKNTENVIHMITKIEEKFNIKVNSYLSQ